MKIGVWHNLPSGGGKRALFHQVKGLRDRGHTVSAWCPPTADQTHLPLSELVEERVLPLKESESHLGVFSSSLGHHVKTSRMLRNMRDHCSTCVDEMVAREIDLVFVAPCRLFRTSPIGRLFPGKSLLYLQEPHRRLFEFPQVWLTGSGGGAAGSIARAAKRIIGDYFTWQATRRTINAEIQNAAGFDCILVNSMFSREAVLRAYGIESEVCYLGVDAEFWHPSSPKPENYIVGMGNVDLNKGLDRAIKAVGAVQAEIRPPLKWIGNYCDPQVAKQAEKLARSLGVRVEFLIEINDDRVRETLSAAQLMLITSRLEPFGLAPLEACACGTPVVAIAEGGVRESMLDGITGFVVPTSDAEILAGKMSILISDPITRDRLSESCRKYARERWTWSASIEKLETILFRKSGSPKEESVG